MRLTDLAAGALKTVRTCAAVRAEETVLILTDVGVSPRVAEALAVAVTAVGGTWSCGSRALRWTATS